ncbi:MAG TPA: DUF4150 domain-containing protein [Gemmatimonadaceae bacterium]|jgi:hypothetical protein
MTVTINVNNLSLVHRGSAGVSMATLPDVCKTPSPGGPVPIPYPNIARSSNLAKGTTTVKADGGNMCANYGSQFSRSNGDEAGTLGGVTSGTFMKEATWLTYSFDVKLEGKGACRLTDKMFHNHQNTVNMAGVVQQALLALHSDVAKELQILCNMMCEIKDVPGRKQDIIEEVLKEVDREMGGRSPLKAEVPFNPKNKRPYMSVKEPWRATNFKRILGSRRPDVVITDGSPPTFKNIKAVVEMKFNDGGTAFTDDQIAAYRAMFGDKLIVMELGKECTCNTPDPEPVPVPVPAPDRKSVWDKVKKYATYGAVGLLGVATVAAALCPFDGPLGEAALGSATAATLTAAMAMP